MKRVFNWFKTDQKVLPIIYTALFFGLIATFIVAFYPNRENFSLRSYLPFWRPILEGFWVTIWISIVSLILSIIIGFLLYIMYISRFKTLHHISNVFTEIVFGSPLIVFLVVVWYFISVPLGFRDNRTLVGLIALSLYVAPYMKNAFEGAFKSVDALQEQAMTVYGFTTYQKYRYIKIPQILKVILPPFMGNLTYIIKGSALLYYIGVVELHDSIQFVQSATFRTVEGYFLLFVMYLLVTIPLIRLTRWFERRFAL
ncbi:MAG: amino acid ABC transporter permease [Bacillota bacterium]